MKERKARKAILKPLRRAISRSTPFGIGDPIPRGDTIQMDRGGIPKKVCIPKHMSLSMFAMIGLETLESRFPKCLSGIGTRIDMNPGPKPKDACS